MSRRDQRLLGSLVVVVVVACLALLMHQRGAPSRVVQTDAGPSATTGTGEGEEDSGATTSRPSVGEFAPLAVGAGGFVTGMSISDDGSTRLVRTDGGGAYRWQGDQWEMVVTAQSLPAEVVRPDLGVAVLAVAVAPSDPSVAYMAYADGLFRSDDGARTWDRVLTGISTAANDNFRTWGSRLAVDPVDPDTVFYGSQLDGLLTSQDGGRTWADVDDDVVPPGLVVDLDDPAARGDVSRATDTSSEEPHLASAGVSAVAFDRSGPSVDGRSQVVYAASYGRGVYRSTDGGGSWDAISPEEVGAVGYLRVLQDGTVLLTSHQDPVDLQGPSDVWRYDPDAEGAEWTLRGPSQQQNWRAIATDPSDPDRVALMAQGGQLALSDDAGASWSLPTRSQTSEGDVPWLAWALDTGIDFMSMGELVFDPVVPGRLWFTEGTGVWSTDLGQEGTPAQVRWQSTSRGLEQLVPTDVTVPPGGAPLLTAWDRAIFRSEDPRRYPSTYGPTADFSSAWSVDYSVTDPDYVVASVASHQSPYDPRGSGFSTDGGRTWQPFPSIPQDSDNAVTTFGFGAVAVGAPGNIVWAPAYGRRPEFTSDGGRTWEAITLPGVDDYSLVNNKPYYVNRQVVTADKTTPGTFYLFVRTVGTFRSQDGAATWELMSDDSAMRGVDYGYLATLKSVPDSPGELYLTPGRLPGEPTQPFLRSTDAGRTWSEVEGLTAVRAFGFGKPLPGSDQAAVYAAGYLDGRYGLYRSADGGRSWTYLVDYPAGRTPSVVAVEGDPDVAGRVFLAVLGLGWVYGDTIGRAGPRG